MPTLTDGDFTESTDPFALLAAWMAEAERSEPNDANAMSLATVDRDGLPDVRLVLLKGADPRGFVFYTNSQSAKGEQLAAVAKAAMVLHWKSLRRQVRARGPVTPVSTAEADAYFASRPRDSRIGAWASDQSRPLDSRATFEAAIARETERFANGDVPRPPHWTGYRIEPVAIEFWQDRPYRLHDRLRFTRDGAAWARARLYP